MSHRQKVAALYLLGFFIDLVNMFIASTAYPDIAREFDSPLATLAWIGNAYILGLTVVIPLSAWLARRYGNRTIFMLSLLTFMLGALGAGVSMSIGSLIAWRWVQGLGGGLLIPLGQTMTYRLYRPWERAGLSSLIMLVGLLAPALSPAIGGVVVDTLSWRWVFLVNLPLAALALLLAAVWLTAERPAAPLAEAPAEQPGPLDISGLLTGASAIASSLLGLTLMSGAHRQLEGLGVLAAGIAAFIFHVRNSRRAHPILDLRLAQDPLLRTSMLAYLLVPGMFMGVSFLATFYLQTVLGMSASGTGLFMVPWAMGAFLAISLTGQVFNRTGPMPLFMAGALLYGAGVATLIAVSSPANTGILVLAYALMGLGSSLVSSAAQSTAFLHIANARLADASALWNIGRQLSFCTGVAALSVLLNVLLQFHGVAEVADAADADTHAMVTRVFHTCFAIAAAAAVIPAFLSLRIRNADVLQRLKFTTPSGDRP